MERRTRWLHAHPLCIHCLTSGGVTAGTVVDHIIPLSEGGSDDESNPNLVLLSPRSQVEIRTKDKRMAGGGMKVSSHSAGHRSSPARKGLIPSFDFPSLCLGDGSGIGWGIAADGVEVVRSNMRGQMQYRQSCAVPRLCPDSRW